MVLRYGSLSKRAMEDELRASSKTALNHDMNDVQEIHREMKSAFWVGVFEDQLILVNGFARLKDATVEGQKVRVDPIINETDTGVL